MLLVEHFQIGERHMAGGAGVVLSAFTEGYKRLIIASTALAGSGSDVGVTVCRRRGAEGSTLWALSTPSASTADAFPCPAASPLSPPLFLLANLFNLRLHKQQRKIPTPNNNADTKDMTL